MGRFSKLEIGGQRPPAPAERPADPEVINARPEEPHDAPGYLRMGIDLFFRRQFKEALRRFSQAIKLDSTLHEAWVGQIDTLIEEGELREAEQCVSAALLQFPDDPTLLSLKGLLLARNGMVTRGLGYSDRAGKISHTLRTWISRGEILLMGKAHGSARAESNANFCLDKALEQTHAGDWQTLTRIGLVWLRNHCHTKAIDCFRQAPAAEPANAQIWRHIAECQARLGHDDQAIVSLQRALEIEPNDNATETMIHRLSKRGPLSRLWRRLCRR